jgi:hypothetical protein
MYIIVPNAFQDKRYEEYKDMKKAKVGSYNSSQSKPISRDEVEKLILDEGLI